MLKFLSGVAFGIFIMVTATSPQTMKNLAGKAVDATHNGINATVETINKPEESALVTKTKKVIEEVAPK
jgi:hypothetical protein